MEVYITDKGRTHLHSMLAKSPNLMKDISNHRLHHDVILFYLDDGMDLEDIYFELVDAASGDPNTASRKFSHEVHEAEHSGWLEGDTGLGSSEEEY